MPYLLASLFIFCQTCIQYTSSAISCKVWKSGPRGMLQTVRDSLTKQYIRKLRNYYYPSADVSACKRKKRKMQETGISGIPASIFSCDPCISTIPCIKNTSYSPISCSFLNPDIHYRLFPKSVSRWKISVNDTLRGTYNTRNR